MINFGYVYENSIRYHCSWFIEIQALVTADIESYVDNARMRQITNHHATDITLVLQGLVRQEVLVQEGQGRWTRYSIPPQSDSVHNETDSVHKGADSIHKEKNYSVHKSNIPDDQWDILLEIAKPARENKRLSPEKMEDARNVDHLGWDWGIDAI